MKYRLIFVFLLIGCSHTSFIHGKDIGIGPDIKSEYSFNGISSLIHNDGKFNIDLEILYHETEIDSEKLDSISASIVANFQKSINNFTLSVGAGLGYLFDDIFYVRSGILGTVCIKSEYRFKIRGLNANFSIGIMHISNPLKNGSDDNGQGGDIGQNPIVWGFEITGFNLF